MDIESLHRPQGFSHKEPELPLQNTQAIHRLLQGLRQALNLPSLHQDLLRNIKGRSLEGQSLLRLPRQTLKHPSLRQDLLRNIKERSLEGQNLLQLLRQVLKLPSLRQDLPRNIR